MRNSRRGKMVIETNSSHRQKFGKLMQSEPNDAEEFSFRLSNASDASSRLSNTTDSNNFQYPSSWEQFSPFSAPSWNQTSPISNSPWTSHISQANNVDDNYSNTNLIGSLVREEGHIYSLATYGDLLYTGSDSQNIRVWKNQKEFSGFKANSGLVKAIVIAGEIIFTGHQDGKIRLWKVSAKNPSVHKKIGTLPTLKDYIKSSIKPSNYVEVRKNRNAVWIKHFDAISCLALSEDHTLLYSGSWDKTVKVWSISNSKCLESINAHDDAVNSVISGFNRLVFTGSADGTVKVWRRELQGKGTKHIFSHTLLKQECAVTALAIDPSAMMVYCGSSDGLVKFWQRDMLLSNGGMLRGHKLAVLCLATAGNLVFSGSADTRICVWVREAEGEHGCLAVLTGHDGPVKCLAVEEEQGRGGGGRRSERHWILYSGSLDKSVKIWRVSPSHMTQMET
ncbi:unnamed protein product [Camellia sinensis]